MCGVLATAFLCGWTIGLDGTICGSATAAGLWLLGFLFFFLLTNKFDFACFWFIVDVASCNGNVIECKMFCEASLKGFWQWHTDTLTQI